jgi:hypothetical protein
LTFLNYALHYLNGPRGATRFSKVMNMDKFLLILAGGSFLGLFGVIAVGAISTGFVVQGLMMGFIGLLFAGMFLYILATE